MYRGLFCCLHDEMIEINEIFVDDNNSMNRGLVSLHLMTFYEKYPQLQEKAFLTKMLTDTVFTTMSLEDQIVSKDKVEEIVLSLLSDKNSERSQLNQ